MKPIVPGLLGLALLSLACPPSQEPAASTDSIPASIRSACGDLWTDDQLQGWIDGAKLRKQQHDQQTEIMDTWSDLCGHEYPARYDQCMQCAGRIVGEAWQSGSD